MSQRLRFVQQATQKGANISQVSRQYGISRKTAYKWLARYKSEGQTGLQARSRRPIQSPARTSAELEQQVLEVRQEYPTWGGRKIKRHLSNQGVRPPSASTITAILHRHGLVDPVESQKRQAWQRFEMAEPNQLWQMDFKGHFAMSNHQRCHPLTVTDDHSRYLLGLRACSNETGRTVKQALVSLFHTYGQPDRMLMDNGTPWGDSGRQPYTALTVWLMHHGIAVTHGRPYHPQTQGKEERLHRTLKYDLLERTTLHDLAHCQTQFDRWRTIYNTIRPHEALGMEVPQTRYKASPVAYCDNLPPITYPDGMLVRRVDTNGRISLKNRPIRVGKAFSGHPVGLQRLDKVGTYDVYFCSQRIKQICLSPQD